MPYVPDVRGRARPSRGGSLEPVLVVALRASSLSLSSLYARFFRFSDSSHLSQTPAAALEPQKAELRGGVWNLFLALSSRTRAFGGPWAGMRAEEDSQGPLAGTHFVRTSASTGPFLFCSPAPYRYTQAVVLRASAPVALHQGGSCAVSPTAGLGSSRLAL